MSSEKNTKNNENEQTNLKAKEAKMENSSASQSKAKKDVKAKTNKPEEKPAKKSSSNDAQKSKGNIAQNVPEVNLAVPKKHNFIKIFTISFIVLDIAFMIFFFTTLTLLVTHTIVWSKVYTIITFAVIIANLPFLIYMLVSMLKTTNNNRPY